MHAEDEVHHDDIRRDLRAFLELRLDGSDHLRSCLETCVERSVGGRDTSAEVREFWREKVLDGFLERAGISFRWLAFALRCMDKPGHGGTDFADAEGLPAGLGLLYRERFSKEITPDKFKQLKPILEVMTVSLPDAPPLTSPSLYDAVRFGGWRGSMRDLETSLEVELGGYMSNCAGVWHMDHRSVSEWLTSGTQVRGLLCMAAWQRDCESSCCYWLLNGTATWRPLTGVVIVMLPHRHGAITVTSCVAQQCGRRSRFGPGLWRHARETWSACVASYAPMSRRVLEHQSA